MARHVEMKWHGPAVDARVREAASEGPADAAQFLLGEAKSLVPHVEGILEASGDTDVDWLSASVYFDTVYARRQHEELGWRHGPGRSAKYLEIPFIAQQRVMEELVAARIRRALR